MSARRSHGECASSCHGLAGGVLCTSLSGRTPPRASSCTRPTQAISHGASILAEPHVGVGNAHSCDPRPTLVGWVRMASVAFSVPAVLRMDCHSHCLLCHLPHLTGCSGGTCSISGRPRRSTWRALGRASSSLQRRHRCLRPRQTGCMRCLCVPFVSLELWTRDCRDCTADLPRLLLVLLVFRSTQQSTFLNFPPVSCIAYIHTPINQL